MFTLACTTKDYNTEQEICAGPMDQNITATFRTEPFRDKVSTTGLMAGNLMDSGAIIKRMDLAHLSGLMAKNM